jgi:hypothetical protein
VCFEQRFHNIAFHIVRTSIDFCDGHVNVAGITLRVEQIYVESLDVRRARGGAARASKQGNPAGVHDRAMRDFENGSSRSDSARMRRGDGTFLNCPFKDVIVTVAGPRLGSQVNPTSPTRRDFPDARWPSGPPWPESSSPRRFSTCRPRGR